MYMLYCVEIVDLWDVWSAQNYTVECWFGNSNCMFTILLSFMLLLYTVVVSSTAIPSLIIISNSF